MFGRNSRAKTEEFETACMSHMDSLYAAALKMTRNQVEAEELVQDTFVRAFRFKKNFEWGTNLKAWLFRILTNTFINDYRHRKHEQRYMERASVEPLYDEVLNRHAAEYASNPENHVFTKFFKEDLDQALDEVPEDFRIAVVLSDIEGFSYKEIAEMLDKPIGTVNLVENDNDERQDLAPWLAALLVVPDARGKGVGTRLVRSLLQEAAGLRLERR